RASPGGGGAAVRGAEGGAPPRPRRGGDRPRAARPVRRLAALLRAPRRDLSDGTRLRGHAVGRLEPARLRRIPARLVAFERAVRRDAGPPRAARTAAGVGRRAPQLHLAAPRWAPGADDGRAAGRLRAGSARGAPR